MNNAEFPHRPMENTSKMSPTYKPFWQVKTFIFQIRSGLFEGVYNSFYIQ